MVNKNEFKKFATKHLGISDATVDKYVSEVEGMTRSVIEERPQPFREIDVFSRLIMERIIFLGMPVGSEVANVVTAQLLFLESIAPKKSITLYLNTPGGSVYDGLAIYDTMQYISSPVGTTCVGLAASMGAVLLAGGEPGKRFSLPHSRIMIHQPLGRTQGQMADMEIAVQEITKLGEDLYGILSRHTGQSLETVRRDANRDYWMRALEAKEYGLIDDILVKNKA
jgi:ATP-dependent Clp protease protease subunit